MFDPAKLLLASLFTGAPLGSLAPELSTPDAIDGLAQSLQQAPDSLTAALGIRKVHLVDQASPELAQETLSVLAPLTDRLGMLNVRAELEDRSFSLLDPSGYRSVVQALGPVPDLEPLLAQARGLLEGAALQGQVTGRVKSAYSLHQKMVRKGLDATEIEDRIGLRLLLSSVDDCYAAVEAIHQNWEPVQGAFDDYIARPKSSGYRSLHTAVQMPRAGVVEFQVRTYTMHDEAESGEAAHWRYKLAAT
ncbi:MAG: bifunctional (p)ppGpp synthetase/guanosine-3',5'-bis(diphosphate) 3'-pyrophosphohydrolase [Deltaproteobacteria bacterium]|nr:MAG: bifunctional (p)ppGpp synthetase/guanosine-3',5'-bis(diphosphate) 3'-pyrophosphohydrolase [Deltaproteobacteria bacterium]